MNTMGKNRIINYFIYTLIGVNAGLALFIVYYWLLLRSSTFTAFYYNTRMDTAYMWTYISTTIATVILFGLNIALAVYLYRRTKRLTIKDQSGTIMGGTVGAFAAACPVCGAFLLSLIGVTGGLVALPFNGLELKIGSLVLIVLSLWLITKKIKQPCCSACPAPETAHFAKQDVPLMFALIFLLFVLTWIGWGMLQTESFI